MRTPLRLLSHAALGTACLLAACTAPGLVDGPAANASATPGVGSGAASAPDASASGGTVVQASSAPSQGGTAGAGFALPVQVNLPLPSALLGGQAALLLSPAALTALAKDPGAQASQGLRIGANGSSIVSNNSGSLIGNHGSGFRLAQALDASAFFPLSVPSTPQALANAQLLLYAWHAHVLNQMLATLGQVPAWEAQKAAPVLVRLQLAGGASTEVLSNAVPTAGPHGPILWLFDVGEPLVLAQRAGASAGIPQRPAQPYLAVELLGEGKARILWVPIMPGVDLACRTEFDLLRRQVLAELGLRSANGQQERRMRLAFDEASAALRVRSQALHRGPEWPGAGQARRLALQTLPQGQGAQFSAQLAPVGGAFAWVGESGQPSGGPLFHALDAEGQLQGSLEGPRADELAATLALEGLGAFEGEVPPTMAARLDQDPGFAWPVAPPSPDAVATSPELMAGLTRLMALWGAQP